MEFTDFDGLKNLLGAQSLGSKPGFMQRNIIGSSIKVSKMKNNPRMSGFLNQS